MTDVIHFLLAMNYRFTYFRFRSLLKIFKENARKLMLYITLYYSNFCNSFYMTTTVRTVFLFSNTRPISWSLALAPNLYLPAQVKILLILSQLSVLSRQLPPLLLLLLLPLLLTTTNYCYYLLLLSRTTYDYCLLLLLLITAYYLLLLISATNY